MLITQRTRDACAGDRERPTGTILRASPGKPRS
jgi:hypothetical protein